MDKDSASRPIIYFQLDMFKRVIISVAVCTSLLVLYFSAVGRFETALTLFFGMVAFVSCYFLAKHKDIKLGTSLFLLIATSFACMFMWRNEGIFDEAILAFPGFLIFAVLLSSVKLAIVLFVIVAANMLLIGLVNEYGIYTHEANASNLDSAIILIIILLMVSFSVYLVSLSIQRLLSELGAENFKVKQSKKEIVRLQNHDPLTGLPNRVLAHNLFSDRIKIGAREDFETSLLFIDLDNFKDVNDTHGHAVGDGVLKTVAERLSKSLRETDAAFRFGGDEFIVLAMHEHESIRDNYSPLAEKLLAVLSKPIVLDKHQISLTVSIGIAVAPTDADTFDQLYQKADLAMYATKQDGRNNYRYFTSNMSKDSARQLNISQALRSALKNEEFALHFQSSQNIETGKIHSAEALLRWQHPEYGTISPSEFIPIAEQSGSIDAIGSWVLNEAVKACKHWHDSGFDEITVAVNVSAIQFNRGNFADKIKSVLSEHQLDGRFLILELTESLLFDMQDRLVETISMITQMGVKIAIDDFGTGYSNLSYLHKSNINILKIDRSFIQQVTTLTKEATIVETIVNMSKNLDMEVVAEGVECQETVQLLEKMNCLNGQGFFWSKALSNEDFMKFLTRNSRS